MEVEGKELRFVNGNNSEVIVSNHDSSAISTSAVLGMNSSISNLILSTDQVEFQSVTSTMNLIVPPIYSDVQLKCIQTGVCTITDRPVIPEELEAERTDNSQGTFVRISVQTEDDEESEDESDEEDAIPIEIRTESTPEVVS